MFTIIAFTIFGFASALNAAISCPPEHTLIDASTAVTADVLQAAQIDDADRRLAAKYAAEHGTDEATIKRRYAATGDITCNGVPGGQANVTVVADVITTSAHSIFGRSTCGNVNDQPKNCKILLEVEGEKQSYDIKSVINTGWICGSSDFDKAATDWAVLRLTRKVDPRVKPYAITTDVKKKLDPGTPVTAIGKSVDFPKDAVTDILKKPRHYGDCESGGLQSYDSARTVTLTCDLSPGSSGGALVTRGDNPVLMAVHVGIRASGMGCTVSPKKKSGAFGRLLAH